MLKPQDDPGAFSVNKHYTFELLSNMKHVSGSYLTY